MSWHCADLRNGQLQVLRLMEAVGSLAEGYEKAVFAVNWPLASDAAMGDHAECEFSSQCTPARMTSAGDMMRPGRECIAEGG